MRYLFVSSTTVGGSGRSQRELAAALIDRGHEVLVLADDGRRAPVRRWLYEQLSDLSERVGRRPGGGFVRWLARMPGRQPELDTSNVWVEAMSPVPENAAEALVRQFGPDVVVGNSVLRLTWRQVRGVCERRRIATLLYVREVAALNHFSDGARPADGVLANAASLGRMVAALGHACTLLPSVIDTERTRVESTRTVALMVNPIASHGLELTIRLAEALPEIPFVLQESWPLDRRDWERLAARTVALPNVSLRRSRAPGPDLYRDARVLLVPHRLDNRPRVVAEAQANGIPALASQTDGLEEAVGPGGVLLDMDDFAGWRTNLQRVWSDGHWYRELVDLASLHSRRPELDPHRVTDEFHSLARRAVDAGKDTDAAGQQ